MKKKKITQVFERAIKLKWQIINSNIITYIIYIEIIGDLQCVLQEVQWRTLI